MNSANLEESNKRLKQANLRLRRKITELTFLYEVGSNLMRSFDLKTLLDSILHMAMKITQSEAGCILFADDTTTLFEVKLSAGNLTPEVEEYIGRFINTQNLSNIQQVRTFTSGDKEFDNLRKLDVYIRSMIALPLQIENKVIGLILLMHRHSKPDDHHINYSQDDRRTLAVFAQQAALILENTKLKIDYAQRDIYLKTITALTSAIDAKDVYTQNHSQRVAGFSVALAKELKLTKEEVVEIRYGAILHDIGKIGIGENILNKPGNLTEAEFKLVKNHPVTGTKILQPIDFLKEALNVVNYHHERYDGTGYPEGLKGEGIPYSARIVGIADAWDAMTSHRSYRKALPVSTAIRELEEGSGGQFDPVMVNTFVSLVAKKTDFINFN